MADIIVHAIQRDLLCSWIIMVLLRAKLAVCTLLPGCIWGGVSITTFITGELLYYRETALMRDHPDDRPLRWETTDERPSWWHTTPMTDRPDKKPHWWKPPWWKNTSLLEPPFFENFPHTCMHRWKTTLMKKTPLLEPLFSSSENLSYHLSM